MATPRRLPESNRRRRNGPERSSRRCRTASVVVAAGAVERAPPLAPARAAEPAPRLWRPADGRAVLVPEDGTQPPAARRPAEPAVWRPDPRQAARPHGRSYHRGSGAAGALRPVPVLPRRPRPSSAEQMRARLPWPRACPTAACEAPRPRLSGYSKDSRPAPRHFRGCWCNARAGSSRGCPETGRDRAPAGPCDSPRRCNRWQRAGPAAWR